ncbi:hypothetical protein FA95DRAFT_1560699 [Auriscalpium vulgare]|uniref:Uncharacterized protein n=2 Tax=Auriscalpium vulgare TaxID=40419 RepID=A0ACB8RPI7_9AGAM|nr:hypothetical protein FA95DRAFT_1596574 [Auriscalpium vulgare]KAI0045914.1 hypothetical protein FA95DRAFT_1560699 [Auriscalpium vulgare]
MITGPIDVPAAPPPSITVVVSIGGEPVASLVSHADEETDEEDYDHLMESYYETLDDIEDTVAEIEPMVREVREALSKPEDILDGQVELRKAFLSEYEELEKLLVHGPNDPDPDEAQRVVDAYRFFLRCTLRDFVLARVWWQREQEKRAERQQYYLQKLAGPQ